MLNTYLHKYKAFTAPILWAVVILLLTGLPGGAMPSMSGLKGFHLDKIVHAFIFGIQFLLLYLAWDSLSEQRLKFKKALLLAVLVAVFGWFTEVLQIAVWTQRSFEWADLLADVVGVFIVFFLLRR